MKQSWEAGWFGCKYSDICQPRTTHPGILASKSITSLRSSAALSKCVWQVARSDLGTAKPTRNRKHYFSTSLHILQALDSACAGNHNKTDLSKCSDRLRWTNRPGWLFKEKKEGDAEQNGLRAKLSSTADAAWVTSVFVSLDGIKSFSSVPLCRRVMMYPIFWP